MDALLLAPAREVFAKIISFLSLGMAALLVVTIGWILAKAARTVLSRVLKAIKIDSLAERSGIARMLAKGEINYTLSDLIALIIYWLIMLVVIMVTANVLGLTTVAKLLDKIVLYIPNVIAALMVLVIGALVAVFLRKVVETTAKHAGLTHANTMGMLTHTVIIVFTVIIALEQLNIGNRIPASIVMILVGSVGLAFALAFGLGCKDIAAEAMTRFMEKNKTSKHK